MNSVFSMDDLSDPFWQYPTPSMNHSASERELAKLFEEVSSAATTQSPSLIIPSIGENDVVPSQRLTRYPSDPIDSEEYRALLKSKLDLACAAVAMSRTLSAKPEEIPSVTEDQSLASKNFQLGSQAIGTGNAVSTALPVQSATESRSIGNPAVPAAQRKHDTQVRQATSASSREDSDDYELEGDTGTNEHTDPVDAKRVRRMQSNRESARRSRRRKQAQLNELETQVGQLKDERSTLLSRFTDINQKCDEAAVDNRILKADIETLRAKVKMAEEQVKRVTGLNPMLLARSNSLPNIGMQYVGAEPSMNFTVPVHPNCNYFHQPVHNVHSPASHLQGLNSVFSNNTVVPPIPTDPQMNGGTDHVGGLPSLQLPAGGHNMTDMSSLHHLQKPFHPAAAPNGTGTLNGRNSGPINPAADDNKKN